MNNLYYQAPTDEQFNELKQKAIEVWNTYDNQFGYVTEKVDLIKDLKNIEDNFMYMVAMFDIQNQSRLAQSLSTETREAVNERMKAGGQPDEFNPFLDVSEKIERLLEEIKNNDL